MLRPRETKPGGRRESSLRCLVRARGARTIIIAEEGDSSVDEFAEVVFRVPAVPTLYAPLLTVVPLQIFACELAAVKGLDVDQPRNLAKSVTVE